MKYLSQTSPDIQQVSIDECYMDYAPISTRYTPSEAAAGLQKAAKPSIILDQIRRPFRNDALKRGSLPDSENPTGYKTGARNT